jgi:hypothetical protein
MKKYLLGILAVVFAVSLSAFNNMKPKAKFTDPYWFKISKQHVPGSSVPSSDAVFIQQSATPPTDPVNCPGTTYDCIAGFTQSQVNTSNNTLNGSQVPSSVSAMKDN